VYKTYQENLLGALSFGLAMPTTAMPTMVKARTFLQNHKQIQKNKGTPMLTDQGQPQQGPRLPIIHVPLNCQEDSLLGAVDLECDIEMDQSLYHCHEGLLIVDDLQW